MTSQDLGHLVGRLGIMVSSQGLGQAFKELLREQNTASGRDHCGAGMAQATPVPSLTPATG